MNFNDQNQVRQPQYMQHTNMPPQQQQPSPQFRRIAVTKENLVDLIRKLPAQNQSEVNNLITVEEKISYTQNIYDRLLSSRQKAMRMQQQPQMQSQHAPPQQQMQQRSNMQPIPRQQLQQNNPYSGNMPIQNQSQPHLQQNFPMKQEPPLNQNNFQVKPEGGFQGQQFQQQTQLKMEPSFSSASNFQAKEQQLHPHQPQQFYSQNQSQMQQNRPVISQQPVQQNMQFDNKPQLHEQQHLQRLSAPRNQMSQQALQKPQQSVPFPGPGPESNDRHTRMMMQQQTQPQSQGFPQNQPPPAMPPQNHQQGFSAQNIPQAGFHQQQMQQQQRHLPPSGYTGPGQFHQQQFPPHTQQQQTQQGPSPAYQQFPQTSQPQTSFANNPNVSIQSQSIPPQQTSSAPIQSSQQSNFIPPSNQPIQSQGTQQNLMVQQHQQAQQQNLNQGASPALQQVNSVGRAPTPSIRSNQSGGQIASDVQSADYQAVFKELCGYKDLCKRLYDRMVLDNDPKMSNFSKVLQIIEGKMQVQKELLVKLIKNIQSLASKYDVTYGLEMASQYLQKFPPVDLTKTVDDPYEPFKDKMLKAPKHLYNMAEFDKIVRKQRMFMRKKVKFIEDNESLNSDSSSPVLISHYNRDKTYEVQQQLEQWEEKNEENGEFEVDDVECLVREENIVKELKGPNDFYDDKDDTVASEDDVNDDDLGDNIIEESGSAYLDYIKNDVGTRAHASGYVLKKEIDDEPAAKRPKLSPIDEESEHIPQPYSHFAFPLGRAHTALNYPADELYEEYLKRQQQEFFDRPLSMNTRLAQHDQLINTAAMPVHNPTDPPVMDPENLHVDELSDECPYNCCVPYFVNSLIGKPAKLPQHAATELRRFRHRADSEFLPLSEHSQVFSVIVNPSKTGSYNYPEIRIFIHRDYPQKAADYHLILPTTIKSKTVKSFYKKLEEKMENRRLSGVPLRTITEIISAFKVAIDTIFIRKDVLNNE